MAKKWIFPAFDGEQVRRLADDLGISRLTARMLVNRRLIRPAAAQQFLQPSLEGLVDPAGESKLAEAAGFLLDAVRAGQRITVFGDYDADGICAAAVLMRTMRFLGAGVRIYIPHRVEEGYGLSHEAVRELAEAGTEVLVTVDCGIAATEQVALARRLGMQVLVTDHHEPREGLPDADYLLNPKLDGCRLGYRDLAGVGVAFKLVWALGRQLSPGQRVSEDFRDLMMEALALVAIGTVADVVPLLGENRVLVRYGLKSIAASERPGLRVLLEMAGLKNGRVSASDVAFRIAPLLNAAGRMAEPDAAVELLTTCNAGRAEELGRHLRKQNRLRRKVQRNTCKKALERVTEDERLRQQSCIVVADPDWHRGIVGLVASRLAEKFWRPAFVLSLEGDVARGSGRSIPGFPLFEAVRRCADLLDRYGGHQGAAGISLPRSNLESFTERINQVAAEMAPEEEPTPELHLDGESELKELNLELLREMNLLAPFGEGNPQPLFAASGLRLVGQPRTVGSTGRHLAFMVRQGPATLRVFAPGKADWVEELRGRKGELFSLAFEPNINRYRGRTSVELRARDMRWDGE